MSNTESLIHALESADLDALMVMLDDEPSRTNSFLTQHRPWGIEQWMPLHFAAAAGRAESVAVLLDCGVHPDCRSRFASPMQARQTPLHLAAAAGHAEVVRLLLDRGAETAVFDAQRRSPLWLAARHGHAEALQSLVDHGSDLEPRDAQGRPPLHAALLPPDSPGQGSGTSVPVSSTPDFDLTAALTLLDAGADPNSTCPKEPAGYTPLHRCVSLGDTAMPVAERLLAAGADVSLTDPRHGHTPADLAKEFGKGSYLPLLAR